MFDYNKADALQDNFMKAIEETKKTLKGSEATSTDDEYNNSDFDEENSGSSKNHKVSSSQPFDSEAS